MNTSNQKCVMIIDEEMPLGFIANTSAILGISLGKLTPKVVGQDVVDKDNNPHIGIIEFPVPILKAKTAIINQLRNKLYNEAYDDLKVIDFSTLAQSCKTYDEYIEKMAHTRKENLNYIGIAICGDKKEVNKLTGNLPLLK